MTDAVERCLKCPHCDYVTTYRQVLKTHLRVHTGERPYVCKECGMAFTQLSNCNRHMLTHSSVKAFHCVLCSFKAKRKESLKVHMMIHNNVYFECKICFVTYKQENSLRDHMRRQHLQLTNMERRRLMMDAEVLKQSPSSSKDGGANNASLSYDQEASTSSDLSVVVNNDKPDSNKIRIEHITGNASDSDLKMEHQDSSSDQILDFNVQNVPTTSPFDEQVEENQVTIQSPVLSDTTPDVRLHNVPSPQNSDSHNRPANHNSNSSRPANYISQSNNLSSNQNGNFSMQKVINNQITRPNNVVNTNLFASDPHMYVCSTCQIYFVDHVMYTIHMGCHGFQNSLQCNICGHPCQDKYDFASHIARGLHVNC